MNNNISLVKKRACIVYDVMYININQYLTYARLSYHQEWKNPQTRLESRVLGGGAHHPRGVHSAPPAPSYPSTNTILDVVGSTAAGSL